MRSIVKNIKNSLDSKFQLLLHTIQNSKTIFNPRTAEFNMCQLNLIITVANKSKSNLHRNFDAIIEKLKNSEEWLAEIKNHLCLMVLLRHECSYLSVKALDYLNVDNKIQKIQKDDSNTINDLVRLQLVANIKMYLLRVCQNIDLYKQAKQGIVNHTADYILFKILNIVKYLLATKGVLTKLFKNFDVVPIFVVLVDNILQELVMWYRFYNAKLEELLNSQSWEDFSSINLLTEESKRMYSKIRQISMFKQIYDLKITHFEVQCLEIPLRHHARVQFSKVVMTKSALFSNNTTNTEIQMLRTCDDEKNTQETPMSRSLVMSRKQKKTNKTFATTPDKKFIDEW